MKAVKADPAAHVWLAFSGALACWFGFGDSWQHEVVIQKILPASGVSFASCLAGARAGPPEDCGGVPGYENLVAAMANPRHPGRQDLLEWLGEPFDPDAFDVESLNRSLKRLKL